MRWAKSDNRARVRSGFLFLPKLIGREWRWLEFATWRVKYFSSMRWSGWLPDKWLDDEPRYELTDKGRELLGGGG